VKGFYTFVYAATSDSLNKGAGDDAITGFAVSLEDLLDFYLLKHPKYSWSTDRKYDKCRFYPLALFGRQCDALRQ
jgi:hypothetical protein